MTRIRAKVMCFAIAGAVCLLIGAVPSASRSEEPSVPVTAVEAIGFTVSNMDRALTFYTQVLPFEKISDTEVAGRSYELLTGVFGARSRIVRLRLAEEEIELTEFLAPKGRPVPADVRPNDRVFQHIAIVVRDLPKAYAHLRRHGVEHASPRPQQLPEWNPNAGGISAFYFRDPDRHFLELIAFPQDKGSPVWHDANARRGLFLGIDHTAIVVDDTEASLRLYRDALGMHVVGESENYDIEQEHLNNVFGARLRITALRAGRGPGVELLEYLAPRDGRPAPLDLRANDLTHWETTLATNRLDSLLGLARAHRVALVSPGPVSDLPASLTFRLGALARDPDGHGLRFAAR
jgi:catechol 2,3-dioxygenase-like lactoylglutathione lyase family enzyme